MCEKDSSMKICYSYNSKFNNVHVNWWPWRTLQIVFYSWVIDTNPKDCNLDRPIKF